ncbi:MAG: response regulator transcription factor, partial [Rhodoferax sp.]|nr:response regulator transcription factor [Rhodoferax sp.]
GEAAMAVLAADGAGYAAPSREALEAALQDAQALGAAALAGRLQRRLERTRPERAASNRGPYRAAATHPWGFTAREAQVANLLADGLSNVQIADRLKRSVRTVDHHVSAILAKLAVQTRTQAVARLLAEGRGRPAGEAEGVR